MRMKIMRIALSAGLFALLHAGPTLADDIACVSTTFRFIGANDKVCVSAFDDPKVPGVACHISQATYCWSVRHIRPSRRPIEVLDCVPSGGSGVYRPGDTS
jgi:catabolite regulation protein CreA